MIERLTTFRIPVKQASGNPMSAQSLTMKRPGNLTRAVISSLWSSISTPLPNPFPVPESDLTLLFGPHRALPANSEKWITYMLIQVIEKAWQLLVENKRAVPFPFFGKIVPPAKLSVIIEPRTRPDGRTPLLTSSMVADAAVGIVYYMLAQGFFGSAISVVWPDSRGIRIVVATIHIRHDPDIKPPNEIAVTNVSNVAAS